MRKYLFQTKPWCRCSQKSKHCVFTDGRQRHKSIQRFRIHLRKWKFINIFYSVLFFIKEDSIKYASYNHTQCSTTGLEAHGMYLFRILWHNQTWFNSMWSSDVKWRYRSLTSLFELMDFRLFDPKSSPKAIISYCQWHLKTQFIDISFESKYCNYRSKRKCPKTMAIWFRDPFH